MCVENLIRILVKYLSTKLNHIFWLQSKCDLPIANNGWIGMTKTADSSFASVNAICNLEMAPKQIFVFA